LKDRCNGEGDPVPIWALWVSILTGLERPVQQVGAPEGRASYWVSILTGLERPVQQGGFIRKE